MTLSFIVFFTRTIFYITAIGGFLLSIYLIPLVLTYTCEFLAYSTLFCLLKVTSIIVLHFFIPTYFIFYFNHRNKSCMIFLFLFGFCLSFMFVFTGWVSLALGIYFIFSAIYFLTYTENKKTN